MSPFFTVFFNESFPKREIVEEQEDLMAPDSAVHPLLSMRSGEAPLERRKATISSAAASAAYISAVDPSILLTWKKNVVSSEVSSQPIAKLNATKVEQTVKDDSGSASP